MVMMSEFARTQMRSKYAHTKPSGHKEEWEDIAKRQAHSVVKPYLPRLTDKIEQLISERKFVPGGRYLNSAGRDHPQVNNCFLFKAEDTTEGWGELMQKATLSLMGGGGVGVVYSWLREYGKLLSRKGGFSSGPVALMHMVNESGRYIMQGGSRRSAIWAGLHWNHPDIMKFIHCKVMSPHMREMKNKDYTFPIPMEGTNISVILDDSFFACYNDPSNKDHKLAYEVYWTTVRRMLKDGEPGFSIDIGGHAGENLRNACTEVTSSDDSDMCNLGSANLSRYDRLDDFMEDLPFMVAFLLCGTLYSHLPTQQMYKVREKNRRLGLGLMGIHEWLIKRGKRYGPDSELEAWLDAYTASGAHANRWSDALSCSRPVATRSIAPNGTISIVAETTSGIEPIPAVAYRRRYQEITVGGGHTVKAQYVIDPTAHRLIQQGADPELIEDAFTLAEDVDRRLDFQAWIQEKVDHAISSTINLPSWGSSVNNESTVKGFGDRLLQRLPKLRGITAYPDGSRGGQPITRVSYQDAIGRVGVEFEDNSEMTCKSGVCGS